MTRNLSYVARQVRRFDHDRYLAALFAPDDRREDLLALYAFNIEIAKTREVVSEPLLGEIRLQWWRDALSAIEAGAPPAHEVVAALAAAIRRRALAPDDLLRLIDARVFDLGDAQPEDMEALETYAENTAAPLVALGLRILGAWRPALEPLARHAGIATALVGLIRAVPFHARQRRIYLPRTVTSALEPRTLFELEPSAPLAEAVMRVAAEARRHVAEARRLAGDSPRAGLASLLGVTLADAYLRRLDRASGNPFDPSLAISAPRRQMILTWAAMRGRV